MVIGCCISYTPTGIPRSVSAAVQTATFVNAGLFSVLAVVAFLQWRTGGARPLLWAALGFAAIDLVSVSGLVTDTPPDGVVRIELVLLVLFPYLLYRFTTAFEQAPVGLERFVGVMTIVLVLWSAVLPDIPGPDDAWSNGFAVYVAAFLFHWSILSIIAAVRLWRAGEGQPSVARRRMRFLSAASALLTAAILLAGLGSSEDSLLSLLVNVLAGLSAIGFILGVAPPVILRLLWRRPEVARSQAAIARLMRAETPDEVTAGVLPAMVALVGARAVELRDASGQIVGSYRPRESNGEEEVEVLDLALPEGSLSVWTSKHAPFFGEEELAILRTLGSLTVLALDRARLFSQEQAARQALEEADELKMNFVALAAHELRTPVAVIHGAIETLDRRTDLASAQRAELDDVLRSQTTRLKDLVEQLLDLSRLDANAVSIEPRKIPVRHRVEEIVALTAGERLGEVEGGDPRGARGDRRPECLRPDPLEPRHERAAVRRGAGPNQRRARGREAASRRRGPRRRRVARVRAQALRAVRAQRALATPGVRDRSRPRDRAFVCGGACGRAPLLPGAAARGKVRARAPERHRVRTADTFRPDLRHTRVQRRREGSHESSRTPIRPARADGRGRRRHRALERRRRRSLARPPRPRAGTVVVGLL